MVTKKTVSNEEVDEMIEMRKAGRSICEIAYKYDLCFRRAKMIIGHIKPCKERFYLDWSKYDDDIVTMARQGMSHNDIAKNVCLPPFRVSARLNFLRRHCDIDIPYQRLCNRYTQKGGVIKKTISNDTKTIL